MIASLISPIYTVQSKRNRWECNLQGGPHRPTASPEIGWKNQGPIGAGPSQSAGQLGGAAATPPKNSPWQKKTTVEIRSAVPVVAGSENSTRLTSTPQVPNHNKASQPSPAAIPKTEDRTTHNRHNAQVKTCQGLQPDPGGQEDPREQGQALCQHPRVHPAVPVLLRL